MTLVDDAHAIAVRALGAGPAAAALAAEIVALTERALPGYSAALDEVFALRGLCAYESLVTKAHLEYKAFPKSRREAAETSVRRLTDAARGKVEQAVAALNLRPTRTLVGAAPLLTRASFEAEKGLPGA